MNKADDINIDREREIPSHQTISAIRVKLTDCGGDTELPFEMFLTLVRGCNPDPSIKSVEGILSIYYSEEDRRITSFDVDSDYNDIAHKALAIDIQALLEKNGFGDHTNTILENLSRAFAVKLYPLFPDED